MTTLNTPAAARLRQYRRLAWESVLAVGDPSRIPNQAYAKANASLDWRYHRERDFHTPAKRIATARQAMTWGEPTPNVCDRALYADSFEATGLRDLGTAEEVSRKEGSRRVDNTGWYVDGAMSETVSGHVLQLPGRAGVPQYVAAVSWSDRDGVTVWPNRMTESALDAAGWADQEAQRIGEDEREYSRAYNAGARYAELMAEAKQSRQERRALAKELKAQRKAAKQAGLVVSPVVCATLKEKLDSLYEAGRKAYDKAAKKADDFAPWVRPAWADSYQVQHGRDPFPNGNPSIDRLAEAFRSGAVDGGASFA